MLSRGEILTKVNLKKEKISIPEWGGDVFVSQMTGESRDEWESFLIESKTKQSKNFRACLVVSTLVDDKGERIFQFSDIQEVGKLSFSSLDKICEVAQRINGIGNQDDIEKN